MVNLSLQTLHSVPKRGSPLAVSAWLRLLHNYEIMHSGLGRVSVSISSA